MFAPRPASVRELLKLKTTENERIGRPGAPAPRPKAAPDRRKLPLVADGLARFEFFGRRPQRFETEPAVTEPELRPRDLLTGMAARRGGGRLEGPGAELATELLAPRRRSRRLVPAQPPARGARALYERCIAEGYALLLTADGTGVAGVRPGGTLHWGDEAITAAAPLIAAHLRGETPRCELPHADEPPEAWTVASAGGVMVCRGHVESQ